MGNTNSPGIASNITTIIVQLTLAAHQRRFPDSRPKYDIIIDDVLFASSDREILEDVIHNFDRICRQFNVTISSTTDPSQVVTHRGATFDLQAKTQSLKQAFIEKLSARACDYAAEPNMSKARSLLGSIAYAAAIIDVDPSNSFRQFASELLNTTNTPLFTHTLHIILTNTPRPLQVADTTPSAGIVCADATPTKIAGFYLTVDDEMQITSRDTPVTHIHLNEARATIISLQLLPRFRITHSITIYTDNQSWLGSVSNTGRTTTAELEHERTTLLTLCRDKNIIPIFRYIASANNPADILSRSEHAHVSAEDARKGFEKEKERTRAGFE